MGLLDSLGLNDASADPNDIPDGTYDGEVMKSELVFIKSKNAISHVITYKVTEGDKKGSQKPEFYELGKHPVKADGTPASSLAETVSFTPSMDESRKPWYNKRAMDLIGERFTDENLSKAVGVPVAFNVRTENGYQNIKWVNKRTGVSQAPVSPEDFATAPAVAAAAPSGDPGF